MKVVLARGLRRVAQLARVVCAGEGVRLAMRPSLLQISHEAGDANVGQTILRLAALAASAHRLRLAAAMEGRGSDIAGPTHGRAGRPEGAAEHGCDGDVRSQPASAPAAHTEVSP